MFKARRMDLQKMNLTSKLLPLPTNKEVQYGTWPFFSLQASVWSLARKSHCLIYTKAIAAVVHRWRKYKTLPTVMHGYSIEVRSCLAVLRHIPTLMVFLVGHSVSYSLHQYNTSCSFHWANLIQKHFYLGRLRHFLPAPGCTH